ncbi:PEP-CTERM system histidine kinase PrsK [Sphingomonas sp. CGMCC 1.13654]|uniref:histidine kinase n=1 Tax=Sphingomonas chungangi TaxID=2683589 RepID=A0A838L1A8_9SPHN|nr:XrtA/PEP-CTERM system histidine kinase PrsK [Sphingomonas chungangi]MBA2933141.1 PEP-CTERM system histidine kinase PrsK [Sphingomonas chungangi]MVW56761.1 PEP-CTERM system histidine kinase PrsK [Sphingomonas chungangi]
MAAGVVSPSRKVVVRALAITASLIYLAAAAMLLSAVEPLGLAYEWAARLVGVFGATFAAMLLMPPGRARSWLKLQVAKHLFRHRYDYREEWLRFTHRLGDVRPGEELPVRIERALADIVETGDARLLIAGASGRLEPAGVGEWPAGASQGTVADFARLLERNQRILDGDALRGAAATPAATEEERELAPRWLAEDDSIWAGVPLVHGERLAGLVLLGHPPVRRRLDWEDYDLLSVAGRQVASHLAEAQGQEALSEARRFHEFNRRFAFIVHDVKNLASQLGLVARNAERHADNPAFRADMVATLKDSVARLDGLLQRLSPQAVRADAPRVASPMALLEAIAQRRRAQHPIRLTGRPDIHALFDPTRLETALDHLVQNAIEASPFAEPVWLSVERRGLEVEIAVLDRGRGMAPDFLRHGLFVPFESTKTGGFGIGAFEARALIAAMGGRLEVQSREGEGTRFAVVLPLADAPEERLSA